MSAPLPEQRARRQLAVSAAACARFLEALEAGWTVTSAAKRAGVHRQRLYELREQDEEFARGWDEALEAGTQLLEDELHRRAVGGWEEEEFDGDGNLRRRVRRYSPALLIFSLKARRPEVYRDQVQRLEVTGANGGPVEMQAGYSPPTLADVLALARSLGLDDAVDGEASEVPELEPGEAA